MFNLLIHFLCIIQHKSNNDHAKTIIPNIKKNTVSIYKQFLYYFYIQCSPSKYISDCIEVLTFI
jgi:hypothetical protein